MATISFSWDVNVRSHPVLFLQPYISFLKISLNRMLIREFQTRDVNAQVIDIPTYFPTHVLRQPGLCQLHVQNSLSNLGLGLPPNVCSLLAQGMSETAPTMIRHVADDQGHMFNGFLLTADIRLTITFATSDYFLGREVTTSNMSVVNFNDDDYVITSDGVRSIERSPSSSLPTSITRRLRPIDKLRKTEHELVNARDANIRDQLGDGKRCSVCLEDYSCGGTNENKSPKDVELVRFGCTHLYHLTCILQWLDVNDSCPLCRGQLYKSS